jgi:N-acetylglucosaminyldiphosphoundecaprenol N-acetyl-beta-D-mannosaminyltransferase
MSNNLQRSVAVMGLPLANLTASESVDRIEELILSGGAHQVATANLDFWLNSLHDVYLHRIIAGCSLVVPDGMPLVWISRLLGKPLKERVSGVDLVPMLAELSAKKGYGIYLLGGRKGVGDRFKELMEAKYPGVNIVGHHSPPLADLERMDHGDALDRIRAVKPHILLVAFGNPKQEKWIRMHAKRLGVPVSIGIGGSMDMLVGDLQRAPKWMQRVGLEWFGRCMQEPTRLFPRYARNFQGLLTKFPRAIAARTLQRPHRGPSSVKRTSDAGMIHLHVQGNMEQDIEITLNRAVTSCVASGQLLVIHLQHLKYASTEGLGALLTARQKMLAAGLSLTLSGASPRMKTLFSAWCLEPLFEEFTLDRGGFAVPLQPKKASLFAALVGKEAVFGGKIEG